MMPRSVSLFLMYRDEGWKNWAQKGMERIGARDATDARCGPGNQSHPILGLSCFAASW